MSALSRWHDDTTSDLSVLVGRTMSKAEQRGDEIHMEAADGTLVRLYHEQDCCEHVTIEDIAGDLDDLVGAPLLVAEVVSSRDDSLPAKDKYDESWTWTFYKFATVKGAVTIRWYGTSNGYYSESVEAAIRLPKEAE